MADPSKPFPDSRPSGVYPSKSGFSIAKFLGLTVALAAGAGAGVVGYMALRDRGELEDEGEAKATPPDVGTVDKQPEAGPKRDLPPEPDDVGHADGKLRLDLPDHESNRPGGGGGGGGGQLGPDVEVAPPPE